MFPFEDTKLLQHPTVERAYSEMRRFFSDGDDFARAAIRAGEIMSERSKAPDPDAIAATVLLDGMIIRLQTAPFAATVSQRAAEIMQNMYDFDPDNPHFESAAEQQIVLAHSIIGLEQVYDDIKDDRLYSTIDYENVKRTLEANEKSLLKAIEGATENDMAAAAIEQLLITKSALDDLVQRKQSALDFAKTGLPDHPLVREVYEYMKAENLSKHPLGGYTDTNAAIAKVVVETGASSDPDVICAALFNQYYMADRTRDPAEFAPRIGELWRETSAWAHGTKSAATEEGRLIRHAAHIYFMEETLASMDKRGDALSAISLEQLEDMKDRLDKDIAEGTHPALLPRLEKGIAEAHRIMYAPQNFKTRKPGSPRIEMDW